jgi:hypothetical protein
MATVQKKGNDRLAWSPVRQTSSHTAYKEAWPLLRKAGMREPLLPHGFSECDPESIEVANDEFAHAVEGIVNSFDDLNLLPEAPV